MAEGYDDIEMKDRNFQEEQEVNQQEETSLDSPTCQSFDISPKTKFQRVENIHIAQRFEKMKDVKKRMQYDVAAETRAETIEKRRNIKKIFDADVRKGAGKNSKLLFEKMSFDENRNKDIEVFWDGNYLGTWYKENKSFRIKNEKYMKNLADLLNSAEEEFKKTPTFAIQERIIKGEKGDIGLTSPRGPIGERGLQGLQGEKGERGERGLQGLQGIQGDRGFKGERGERGFPGEKGERGPRGYKGERGKDGKAIGIPGEKGERGERGEKGEKGDQGIPGQPGPLGPRGLQGEKGDPGSIEDNPEFIKEIIDNALLKFQE